MNIHKHMEAIFAGTIAVAGLAAVAIDSLPRAEAHPATPVARNIATPGSMAVVIVRGHRPPPRP
jgi:hypothetical protein